MNHLIQLLLKPLNEIENIRRSADIQGGNDEFDFEMLNFGAWLCPAGHCTLGLVAQDGSQRKHTVILAIIFASCDPTTCKISCFEFCTERTFFSL